MQPILRFLHLRPTDRRLLAAGAFAVICVRVLLWCFSFKRLVSLIENTALRSARAAHARPSEERQRSIVWAVSTAARYVPRATCLTQALAGQWLFAWFGHPTLLRLGVAKADGQQMLKAHAWLESEGRIVLGGDALEDEEYVAFPLPSRSTNRP